MLRTKSIIHVGWDLGRVLPSGPGSVAGPAEYVSANNKTGNGNEHGMDGDNGDGDVEVMAAGWVRPDAATRVMQIDLQDSSVEYSVLYDVWNMEHWITPKQASHSMLPASKQQQYQPQSGSEDLLL
jgi:hypothetical protein